MSGDSRSSFSFMGGRMESWTEDRVRDLLKTVAELPETQLRGYLLGSKLGELLRKQAPDFNPNVLGDLRLTDLLRRFPDSVTFRPDTRSPDVIVEFPNSRTPARPSDDAVSIQTEVLDQQLWKAMVGNRDNVRWYLDLEALVAIEIPLDIAGNASPQSAPSRAPERFLSIPTIPHDELRAVVRECLDKLDSVKLKEELVPLIDESDWYSRLSSRTYELGLTSWRLAHRRFVISKARAWLIEHGIRPERFIRLVSARSSPLPAPRRERPAHASADPRLESSLGHRDIRTLVQRAVSRMSEQELLDLRIPLRYLI
jgi:hypothetical protein